MNNILNQTKLYTAGLFVLGCAIFSQCSKNAETVTPTPVAVPTIASFTPAEGIVGTVVTITGTNFSTTASSNKVTFLDANAARIAATVTAATATSITTTVPTGAVTGKIWVQVGDAIAKAATAFTVDASTTPATTYTNTIKAKLATCTGCHSNYGTTYAVDKSNATKYNGRIQGTSGNIMPQGAPWSAADKALMQAWVDAGMPE